MVWKIPRVASVRLCAVVLFSGTPAVTLATEPLPIDVFTTSDRAIAISTSAANSGVKINIIEVDALERFNAHLSADLPSDPTAAKSLLQMRLSSLQRDEIATLRAAAIGLSTATQLGVDRTPAIVFNQHAVVYGLTDLTEALRRYRAWRRTSH